MRLDESFIGVLIVWMAHLSISIYSTIITLALSFLLYRLVEQPMIRLGAKIATHWSSIAPAQRVSRAGVRG